MFVFNKSWTTNKEQWTTANTGIQCSGSDRELKGEEVFLAKIQLPAEEVHL